MRWLAAIVLLASVGCGGNPTPDDKVQGNWIFASSDGLTGIGLKFNDISYDLSGLVLTSSNTAQAIVEKGSFSINATTLVFAPTESTCPGPIPIYQMDYRFSGSVLMITAGSNLIAFERNPYAVDSSFALTLGCDVSGSFVPSPIAPVSN
jgi:hypothetical protein